VNNINIQEVRHHSNAQWLEQWPGSPESRCLVYKCY